MPPLSPEQFGRVERLFHEAGQLPPDERPAYVREACADDPEVAREVEDLLRAARSGRPLSGWIDCLKGAFAGGSVAPDARALVGSRIGTYELTDLIGQGGMGVVFRAKDTRLGRSVAIKALPPAFTSDPARLTRFQREAKLLAGLSHPNIATVYGLEESGGALYLVMELVEGRSLADRVARGPMPIADALSACRGIAEAVEAAHDAGVIHRDLKPANVMCTPEGRVKVLDFGLAREVRPAAARVASHTSSVTSSRTVSFAANLAQAPTTRDGTVLGTPGYMSPEQVRGQPVDRRTDVFAIGCILYECLTGRLAFAGKTDADVIVCILDREPQWDALPARTPVAIRRLLRRCLAKEASQRMRNVGDLRLDLEEALAAREWTTATPGGMTRRRTWPRPLPWAFAAVAVLGAVALTAWLRRPSPTQSAAPPHVVPSPLRRFALPIPGAAEQYDLPRIRLGLSRDGSRMAVTGINATDRPQLYIRGREDTEFQLVEGTADAFAPSFSPDGQWVLYVQDGVLRKKRIAGGNAVPVADIMGFWGPYEWGTDGTITIVPTWGVGVARMSASGGPLTYVTSLDASRDEVTHISPCLLPDNSAVLFSIWYGWEDVNVEAVDLRTGKRKPVMKRATSPRLARTSAGDYLLFERSGTIYAAPFDAGAVAVTGPEVPLVDGVLFVNAWIHACYDVADDGTLAYVPGPVFDEQNQLTWVELGPTPAGAPSAGSAATAPATRTASPASSRPAYERRPFGPDRQPFAEVVFSADGKRFSCIFKSKQYHLHVYDSETRTFDRVLTEGDVTSAALSPDGLKVAYSATRDGFYSLYVRRLSDGRSDKVFQGTTNYQNQIEWSPDGRHVAFSMSPRVQDQRDVFVVDVAGLPATDARPEGAGRTPMAFCTGPSEQRTPRFSPNGKWVAYSSSEMGRRDVFLRSFPDGALKRQITSDGGDWADWAPDGQTLYYKSAGKIWAVPVSQETGLLGGAPVVVYDRRFGQIDWELHDFAVHPDPAHRRLLIIELSEQGPRASQINVLVNWTELLAQGGGGSTVVADDATPTL